MGDNIFENMNRVVTVALRRLVARRNTKAFQRAMAEMASDGAIQAENATIAEEFAASESDGLSDDQTRPDLGRRDKPATTFMPPAGLDG